MPLEIWPTKTKEIPSSQEVRLTLLETGPVFLSLRDNLLYENNKARAISPDDQTEYFETKVDVLQDEILVLHLYVIVLEYILRKTYQGWKEKLGF